MEHIAWDSHAKLLVGRSQTAYSGTLSMCVLRFRDQLSIIRQVTSYIALESSTVNGKAWLSPEDIRELMTADELPAELQAAY